MAKAKLGTGELFRTLSNNLAKKGATDPDALAAYIGRKKYGKKKFGKLSEKGKKFGKGGGGSYGDGGQPKVAGGD